MDIGSQAFVQESCGRLWRFAECEFDETRLQLRVKGQLVDLELKPLEVLLQLLVRAGEVVTKEELLASVWPGLMVVDGSIATAVSKLRKALGDEDSAIVLTVPRVGYRLAVLVNSRPITTSTSWEEPGFQSGDAVPGRETWRLARPLDISASSQVWLAEHPKTHELRVFKFASSAVRLKGLKREVTVSRFLRESQGDRPEFVRVLEWNFETHPYFLESEYGGPNLAQWADNQGGLALIPLTVRLQLLAEVAQAVATAHAAGVLHKDLKPSNILITSAPGDRWQVKVADFGSASLLDPARLKALGITNLGLTQTGGPQNSSLTGTLMYLAPEVLSGHAPTAAADVYALGVMLYQLSVGDFRKPLSPGWEAEIDDSVLCDDIAHSACGDPTRRLASAAEVAERLLTLDHRRVERAQMEDAQQARRIAERKRAEARARLPWVAAVALALIAGLVVSLGVYYKKARPSKARGKSVAVLPFQNAGPDHSLDFLRVALADEIATALSYTRSLSIRPFSATSKYTQPDLDLQRAGEDMQVDNIVTGHFLREGDHLQLTLEAIDVSDNRLLWRDTLTVPTSDMIAMREQLVARSQGALAAALGAASLTTDTTTRPSNEEAYDLYLRSLGQSFDPEPNRQAKEMLEKSVGLDPAFAPTWLMLGRRYYVENRYASGREDMMVRYQAALERAMALDPNYIEAGAGLAAYRAERGELVQGFHEAEALIRRRPDSADTHYSMSYVLRFAGLLREAATQCDTAFLLDPHTQGSGLRSCAVVFLAGGDYDRAMDYIHLDPTGSDWAKALSVHALLRQGKKREALRLGPAHIPQWRSFDMLLACADHRPAQEIAALASMVEPVDDPETNYFAASHLAYCGQTVPALQLLKRAIQGSYCSYPAMDSDPFFASVRAKPEFAEIRTAAIACQNNFLTGRGQVIQ